MISCMLRAGRVVLLEVCDAFGMLRQVIEVIAKVESHDSVPNIEEIVAASDAVMVARGDLGARAPVLAGVSSAMQEYPLCNPTAASLWSSELHQALLHCTVAGC